MVLFEIGKNDEERCLFLGVDDSSEGMNSDLESAARYHDFDDEDLDGLDGANGDDENGKVSLDSKGSKKKAPRYVFFISESALMKKK